MELSKDKDLDKPAYVYDVQPSQFEMSASGTCPAVQGHLLDELL